MKKIMETFVKCQNLTCYLFTSFSLFHHKTIILKNRKKSYNLQKKHTQNDEIRNQNSKEKNNKCFAPLMKPHFEKSLKKTLENCNNVLFVNRKKTLQKSKIKRKFHFSPEKQIGNISI